MEQDTAAGGVLHELAWLGMGFVLPCASLSFYRRAGRRRGIAAVMFFLVFSLALTGVLVLSLLRGVTSVQGDVRNPFETGEIPTIVIQDGVATVDGPQPRVLLDEGGTIVVLDTTGTYQQLDRTKHSQGFLLTRTNLHIMDNSGRYQVVPLRDLQETLGVNPIVVNADTVSQAWQAFSGFFTILAGVLLAVWNVLVRFVYLAALALVVWGFVSVAKLGIDYGQVLITGLYAVVPTLYVSYLLGRVGVSFIFLQTLILLPIWAIVLWGIAPETGQAATAPEWSLPGWWALAGIPLLLFLAFDVVFHPPYGVTLVWATALITEVVLVAAEVWTWRRQAGPGAADGTGAAPAMP